MGTPLSNLGYQARSPQDTSVMEGSYRPAQVETCRIINVNIQDWSVDVISEYGNKRFFDIQVSSPYFHFNNGEGIYVQPEIGALCWLCRPSAGKFATPFIMGFQSANDSDNDGFRGGRQTLNPGDIMLRTRDENFLILRRGGVVQIGATPTAQRMYLPIRNFIKDFCENYEMFTFGGEMTWETERDDQTTDGDALTKYSLKVKEKASNKLHVASLTIGSHGESDPTTLLLEVFDKGEDGNRSMVKLTVTKEGVVSWDVQKSWTLTVKDGDMAFKTQTGNYTVDSASKATITSAQDATLQSTQANALLAAALKATIKAKQAVTDADNIQHGSGATSPHVKGDKLVAFLGKLLNQLAGLTSTAPGNPVAAAPAISLLSAELAGLLSTTSFTK